MHCLNQSESKKKVKRVRKSESESEKNSEESSEGEIFEENGEKNEDLENFEKNENGEKFFLVEPNLKDLFSSNDVFKFKFTDEKENTDDEEHDYIKSDKSDFRNNILFKDFGFEKSKKLLYSSSETESDEEEDSYLVNQMDTLKDDKKFDQKINENKSFLPNFESDSQINDALKFFCRPKDFDIETLRKEWLLKRETLVKESKKKHKKMVRIKRTKENENLLPWMKKTNKEKLLNKRRK